MFGALLEYSIILLRIKIYRDGSRLESVMREDWEETWGTRRVLTKFRVRTGGANGNQLHFCYV